MKRTKSLLAVLLLIQFTAFAQVKLSKDFNITVGTPYKVVDAPSKEYFSDNNGHAISIKTDKEKVTLQLYDVKGMREAGRKEYEDFPPENKLQDIIQAGDKLWYVFSSFNKKAKQEDIYARSINIADGTFGASKLLFTTAREVAMAAMADDVTSIFNMRSYRFIVHSSFDNSKLMIRYRLKPLEKDDAKNYDVMGFFVFDNNFEKQWGGEVKMPYTEKEMNNIAYGVTKDGKAFMLARLNDGKRFELLSISSDLKATPNKIDIDGNLMFQELKMFETADGNLTCIGYYANGVDFKVNWTGSGTLSWNMNGILDWKMDVNGKVLQKHDFEFPLDLINQYESKREKGKNEKREGQGKAGINDLKIIDVVLNADGSTIIVGEQQYVRKEMKGTQMSNISYYADLVATKFDASGKIQWMKKLPKTQISTMGKGGLSVKYIKGADASYILYLDNPKNIDLQLSEVPAKHEEGRGGYLTAYKIDDATGNIEKHTITDVHDIKGTEAFQFKTSRIFQASDKNFLLEIYIKGKEDTMVKLQLSK
ncbi:MAG: hypothetical protein ABI763_06545 [Bacteroidota bacterium]